MEQCTRRPEQKETYKKGFTEETGSIVRSAEVALKGN